MKDKILITLATGTTGYATTMELLKEDYPVRIFVRSRNTRALELEAAGAEVSPGEFDNYAQLKTALHGIKTVYYCYPMMKGMPRSVALFIRAAKEENIHAVVFMGQWLAEFDDARSLMTKDIQQAYKLLQNSGLNVVYYNPGFFADNLVALTESIVQLGQMPSPFGDGKCPWISTGDLARVAAALLKHPEPFIGRKVHPTGPKSIDAKEMASVYAKVAGRSVTVLPVSDKMFMKAVLAAADEFGYNAFVAVQTVLYMQELRNNRFAEGAPTNVVKELTGREPENFESIVREMVDHSLYKTRNFSNRIHAIKNFIRLLFTPLPGKKEMAMLNE